MVIPFVIGALDAVTNGFVQGLENFEIRRVETIKNIEISEDTEKSLEDLKDLLSFKLQWKTIG